MEHKELSRNDLKETLEYLYQKYNNPSFIELDPISIPHQFSKQEDIEIAGFLVSIIAWGNRKMIVRNGNRMVDFMERRPYHFVMNHTPQQLEELNCFVHRTFNGIDFTNFISLLRRFYQSYGSMGKFFEDNWLESSDLRVVISRFREVFFNDETPPRTMRHLSNIDRGAACKRICMSLRWFVRKDNNGVDFGLWKKIPSSALYLPLDIHSARVGREFGLLQRKQNDWRAVEEITQNLRVFDSNDPVKYDYSLFGVGVNGGK